jgi:hypothetical protein
LQGTPVQFGPLTRCTCEQLRRVPECGLQRFQGEAVGILQRHRGRVIQPRRLSAAERTLVRHWRGTLSRDVRSRDQQGRPSASEDRGRERGFRCALAAPEVVFGGAWNARASDFFASESALDSARLSSPQREHAAAFAPFKSRSRAPATGRFSSTRSRPFFLH